jgi:hypothetical protein
VSDKPLPPGFLDETLKLLQESSPAVRRLTIERAPDDGDVAQPGLAELLDDVARFLRRFLAALDDDHYAVLALWTAHTWVAEAAYNTPYLHVTSAEIESGKTRVLDALELVCCKPAPVLDPSAASLYRGLDSRQIVTLLVDEVDNFLPGGKAETDSKKTILGILNGGYRRGQSVPRVTDGRHLEWFSPFGPKALTGIGELPRTLASRSIRIRMRRQRRDEKAERFRQKRATSDAQPLVDALAGWATPELIDTLEDADPQLPDELGDREQDICEPLVAIADLAGGDWPVRARASFVHVFADARAAAVSESHGTRLLADLRDLFDADGDRISSIRLVGQLNALDERPWGGWNNGDGLKPRNLGTLLKPYGIHSGTVRLGDGTTAKGYKRESFDDAFTRYLAPETVTSVTTAPLSEKQGVSIRHIDQPCDGSEQGANPHGYRDVTDVTDTDAQESGNGCIGDLDEDEIERLAELAPRDQTAQEER